MYHEFCLFWACMIVRETKAVDLSIFICISFQFYLIWMLLELRFIFRYTSVSSLVVLMNFLLRLLLSLKMIRSIGKTSAPLLEGHNLDCTEKITFFFSDTRSCSQTLYPRGQSLLNMWQVRKCIVNALKMEFNLIK